MIRAPGDKHYRPIADISGIEEVQAVSGRLDRTSFNIQPDLLFAGPFEGFGLVGKVVACLQHPPGKRLVSFIGQGQFQGGKSLWKRGPVPQSCRQHDDSGIRGIGLQIGSLDADQFCAARQRNFASQFCTDFKDIGFGFRDQERNGPAKIVGCLAEQCEQKDAGQRRPPPARPDAAIRWPAGCRRCPSCRSAR